MAAKFGSFRYSFAEKRERLLSTKGYSELGLNRLDSDEENQSCCCSFYSLKDRFSRFWNSVKDVIVKAWKMGVSDPRKIVFSAKMGLALMLISLLIFLKEPFEGMGRYSVWAILTVVVVFEFSIGATLSKGFNRGLGTLSAGGLALGMAELSILAGQWEEIFIVISIFIVGFFITYAKLYPTMKPYEYGFRVFLLTYCFIMVSGYRTREFIQTAVSRFFLIALGACVCLVVNICIYPIWAGEDLHNLVAKNFAGVAASLEGCVNGYLSCLEYERVPSKILTYQASDDDPVYNGYRSAVESTSQEDALMGFAIWEPPHGPYKMLRYPWKNYVKVSGALRHCAFMVMALHGCMLSEIQAPPEKREVFERELQRVGFQGAKVLRLLGNKVKNMERLGSFDILYEVHEAAEALQKKVDRKSYILVNSDSWEVGNRSRDLENLRDFVNFDDEKKPEFREYKSRSEAVLDRRSFPTPVFSKLNSTPMATAAAVPSVNMFKKQVSWPENVSIDVSAVLDQESKTYENASSLSLAMFTSLLIEFVARLQNLVDAIEELSDKARFKDPINPNEAVEVGGIISKVRRCFKF